MSPQESSSRPVLSGPSEPPSLSGSLNPILPQLTGRYDVTKKVQRSHTIVQPGMFLSTRDASPTYLPPHWSAVTHPEGNIYFYRNVGLRVVTNSYMYTPEIGEKTCAWATEAERQATNRGFPLTDSIELYLQVDDEGCNYYFIDRVTQTVFWLDEYDTSELGLHPVVSPSHLKWVLEAQFWSHIENFSMHFGGLSRKSLEDLILIFSHAVADTLTSAVSTFPYDGPTCEKFLNLLLSSRDRIHDGHTVTFVARLWSIIVYNRYETHYGQEQSRLSRDSSILVNEDSETQWTRPVLSWLSFGSSDSYLKCLDDLFVDQFVYGSDWDNFMTQCVKGWQQCTIASMGLLLLHIFCFFLPVSSVLAFISASLCSISFLASILLIHRHEGISTSGADRAFDYLYTVSSPRFKFQGVALAFSLPKAVFLWSILVFFSQWAILLCHYISFKYAAVCVAAVVSVFLAFQLTTSSIQFRKPSFWSLKSKPSEKDEASMV
ncbi:hypothetical protein CPB84DRAFT_1788808 [Gymnopilus junonius]|uniref:WW domain-containing protein n=1 Tax=Gymnopilus junonius TaxID=109634 RepID=A0A9P5NFN5_GYMJU|nr:hypothetical protein CPB84DRAFT_1788808 [Gymnopilus junonius]